MNLVKKISCFCYIALLSLQIGSLRAADQDILTIHMDSTQDFWSFRFHRTGTIVLYYGPNPLSRAKSMPGLIDVDKLWAGMMPYLRSTDDTTPPARLRVSARAISDPPEMQVPWWYVNDVEPFKEFICQLLCVVRSYDPEHFRSLLTDHPILEMEGLPELLSSRADPAERIEWPRPPISDGASDRPETLLPKPIETEREPSPAKRSTVVHSEPVEGRRADMRSVGVLLAGSFAAFCLVIYGARRCFKSPRNS